MLARTIIFFSILFGYPAAVCRPFFIPGRNGLLQVVPTASFSSSGQDTAPSRRGHGFDPRKRHHGVVFTVVLLLIQKGYYLFLGPRCQFVNSLCLHF